MSDVPSLSVVFSLLQQFAADDKPAHCNCHCSAERTARNQHKQQPAASRGEQSWGLLSPLTKAQLPLLLGVHTAEEAIESTVAL